MRHFIVVFCTSFGPLLVAAEHAHILDPLASDKTESASREKHEAKRIVSMKGESLDMSPSLVKFFGLKQPSTKKRAIIQAIEQGCFPSTSKVHLKNGTSVTMAELETGDQIQTVSWNRDVVFSEVTIFLKKQYTGINMYTSIKTFDNYTFSMTGNHLIYARKSGTESFNPIYADQVSIGDELLVNEGETLATTKIINVANTLMQGAYVPVTTTGNIIVDGVLASCYPDVPHDLAHIGMTPSRWFPQIVEWFFGDNDVQAYAIITEVLGMWIMP